jgi:hypothetical protein
MPLNGIEKMFFTPDFGGDMKVKSDIFYSLNIEDIQTVAIQETGRELTDDEIENVKDLIGEKINWYDAILNSIIKKVE